MTAPVRSTRPPISVYVLAFSIFSLGTSEFMIAGLVPDLTADLQITIPQAGALITAFAIGMAIGAPVMAVLTLRLPRKVTLLAAVGIYLVMHVLAVLIPGYSALMITRLIAAVVYATFWAVSAVVAGRLVGPRQLARAMAILVGGLSLANLLGVPTGAWLGERFGWETAFLAVAGASVISGVLIITLVPDTDSTASVASGWTRIRTELRAFAGVPIWLALLTTALFQGGVFAAFSYFAPLLINITGLPAGRVPLYLLLFGVGALAGTIISGRVADRGPLANVMISLAATFGASVVLLTVSGSALATAAALVLYAMAAFSIAGALNARVLTLAGAAPTLAAAVNTSAFNVGNAVGPSLGGLVIAAGLGFRAPVVVGMIMFAGGLGVALMSWIVERPRSIDTGLATPVVTNARR